MKLIIEKWKVIEPNNVCLAKLALRRKAKKFSIQLKVPELPVVVNTALCVAQVQNVDFLDLLKKWLQSSAVSENL